MEVFMAVDLDNDDGVLSDAKPVQTVQAEATENKDFNTTKKCALSKLSLDNWNVVCALSGIILFILGIFFAAIGASATFVSIVFYLSYGFVIASIVLYLVQLFNTKQVAFTPTLVIMLMAIFVVFH